MELKRNPFSKRTSEQELDFLNEIFFEPNYYQTLKQDLIEGDSRFIIGQRGHGKSSIINKLLEDLNDSNIMAIKIDRYDDISVQENEAELITLIIKKITQKIAIFLDVNKGNVKKLNVVEKEKLALLIRIFFTTISNSEYINIYNNVHKVKTKNKLIRFFNKYLLKPTNSIASTSVAITSSLIRDSLGLQGVESKNIYKEFFGEIKEVDFDKIQIESKKYSKDELKYFLDELLLISKKIGFKSTVVLFDKIDEFQQLDQDVNKIAAFTKEILTDTELLLNNNLAIGFTLWSEVKAELGKKVRFDKFESIDISWKEIDMEPLINKRIKYFSIDKEFSLKDLIKNKNDRSEVIKISNNSPRELISVLNAIYNEQSNKNQLISFFESESISKGLINFSSNFNYDSIYPSKVGKNKDIKTMINRLLRVRLTRFAIKDLTKAFNQRTAQSDGQIKLMLQYKLIRIDEVFGNNNIRYYDVIDPKVIFLIRRGITRID